MRGALGRDRRDLGRPKSARFHRYAAACRCVRAVWRGRLFDSARRPSQFERSADALADRERSVADQRSRPTRAGRAGMGCRAVPRARSPPGRWSLAHEAGLSIWLPALAVERWAKSEHYTPDDPVVLTVEGAHGPIIHAATEAAAKRGAKAGARLTDARALDPALVAIPADPEGDAALVRRLARWAGRWSPLVEVDGDGLRLDITGVAHLFGGERGLGHDVHRRFAEIGLTTRIAIAPDRRGGLGTESFMLRPSSAPRYRGRSLAAASCLRPPPRSRHGAHARTTWPEDDWRTHRRSAARVGTAIPRSRKRRSRHSTECSVESRNR